VTRGQATFLRAFSIWTAYVWLTRSWTIWHDDNGTPFKLVHTMLAVVSVAFAVGCWIIVARVRHRAITPSAPPDRAPARSATDR
jgi:hypothetical protein